MSVKPITTCRVIVEARKVQTTLSELSTSMSRLRSAIHQCEDCPDKDCQAIIELSTDITTAINELTLEWGL